VFQFSLRWGVGPTVFQFSLRRGVGPTVLQFSLRADQIRMIGGGSLKKVKVAERWVGPHCVPGPFPKTETPLVSLRKNFFGVVNKSEKHRMNLSGS
jgi:hypothetical protein